MPMSKTPHGEKISSYRRAFLSGSVLVVLYSHFHAFAIGSGLSPGFDFDAWTMQQEILSSDPFTTTLKSLECSGEGWCRRPRQDVTYSFNIVYSKLKSSLAIFIGVFNAFSWWDCFWESGLSDQSSGCIWVHSDKYLALSTCDRITPDWC